MSRFTWFHLIVFRAWTLLAASLLTLPIAAQGLGEPAVPAPDEVAGVLSAVPADAQIVVWFASLDALQTQAAAWRLSVAPDLVGPTQADQWWTMIGAIGDSRWPGDASAVSARLRDEGPLALVIRELDFETPRVELVAPLRGLMAEAEADDAALASEWELPRGVVCVQDGVVLTRDAVREVLTAGRDEGAEVSDSWVYARWPLTGAAPGADEDLMGTSRDAIDERFGVGAHAALERSALSVIVGFPYVDGETLMSWGLDPRVIEVIREQSLASGWTTPMLGDAAAGPVPTAELVARLLPMLDVAVPLLANDTRGLLLTLDLDARGLRTEAFFRTLPSEDRIRRGGFGLIQLAGLLPPDGGQAAPMLAALPNDEAMAVFAVDARGRALPLLLRGLLVQMGRDGQGNLTPDPLAWRAVAGAMLNALPGTHGAAGAWYRPTTDQVLSGDVLRAVGVIESVADDGGAVRREAMGTALLAMDGAELPLASLSDFTGGLSGDGAGIGLPIEVQLSRDAAQLGGQSLDEVIVEATVSDETLNRLASAARLVRAVSRRRLTLTDSGARAVLVTSNDPLLIQTAIARSEDNTGLGTRILWQHDMNEPRALPDHLALLVRLDAEPAARTFLPMMSLITGQRLPVLPDPDDLTDLSPDDLTGLADHRRLPTLRPLVLAVGVSPNEEVRMTLDIPAPTLGLARRVAMILMGAGDPIRRSAPF